jgi:4a-hydroxytetrahydrobiopterin dehydratase
MAPERLTDEAVEARLAGSAWRREGDTIVRDLKLRDFDDAIGFVNKIASVAERHDHHPDILVHGYNGVRLTLSTHSAGGLTELDFDMADRFEELID